MIAEECIWNDIRIDILEISFSLREKYLNFKEHDIIVTFHVAPIGPIKKMPVGYPESELQVVCSDGSIELITSSNDPENDFFCPSCGCEMIAYTNEFGDPIYRCHCGYMESF